MARMRSIAFIENEIKKVEADLAKAQEKLIASATFGRWPHGGLARVRGAGSSKKSQAEVCKQE